MCNGRPPIAGTTSAALSRNYTVLSKEQIVQCSVQSCMKPTLSVVSSQCWETCVSVACAHVNNSLQSIVLLSKDSARVIRGTCICIHFQDSLSDCIVLFTIQVSSDK